MKKYLVLISLFFFSVISVRAQNAKLVGEREISVYKVIVKTSDGTIKGILQKATPDQVEIMTDKGINAIKPESLKSLKIKFDKKKNVPVFRRIAQSAVDVIADPKYTKTVNNTGKNIYGNQIAIDEQETPLGDRLLVGSAMMAGAVLGNELVKLVPPATIETFKIAYSKEKYKNLYEDLLMYTVDIQSSYEYELLMKEKLIKAMKKSIAN